jgi:hypothetical protein
MNTATGAFGQAYGEMSGSVAAQTQILQNRWMLLKEALGVAVAPAFVVILKFLSDLLDRFNQLSPATKRIVGLTILLVSIFAILGGAAVVLLGALAGIFAAVTAAGAGFFGLIGIVALTVGAIAGFAGVIYNAWSNSSGFRDLLIQIKDAFVEFYQDGLLPAAQGMREAWDKHIAPVLMKLRQEFEAHVFPVLAALVHTFKEEIIPAAREVSEFFRVIFTRAVEFVSSVIKTYLIPIFDILHRYYIEHKGAIDKVIQALVFLGKWFLKIAAVVGTILLAVLVGPIIGALVGLAAVIMTVIHVIITIIEWVTAAINWFRRMGDHTKTVSKVVKDSFNTVVAFLQSVPSKILSALGNLGQLLVEQGKNLIRGLMEGIDAMTGGLLGKVGNLVGKVRGFFNSSPAKWGPLAGRGDMFYAGQELVKRLTEGVRTAEANLNYAVAGVAGSARQSLVDAPTTGGRTINQTFNVTTQEISPRVHAAELGREMAGRM